MRSTVSAVSTSVAGKAGRLRLVGDRRGAGVGRDVEGAHPLGDVVAEGAGVVDDLVELEVEVAEVLADDVPVGLLALQVEVGQVDEEGLQVGGELLRRTEGGVASCGRSVLAFDRLGHEAEPARFT